MEKEVRVETMTPQAMAVAGFAAAEGRNTRDTRALEMAANIVTSRLIKRVREELSIVYSISAGNTPSWIYEDAGRFQSGAPCDPGNAAKVVEEAHRIFKEFAEKGPTPEELRNGKKQMAHQLDVEMREPAYWWAILRNKDLRGRDLEAEKRIAEDYERFTADDLREVFAKYYTPDRIYRVTALPVTPTSGGPPEEAR
jgi:zinc protease